MRTTKDTLHEKRKAAEEHILLLVVIPDIAQALQVPAATWMSVMSQSSTNSSIVVWYIAAAIYKKKHL